MRNKNLYSSFSVLNILLFIYFVELIFPPITVVADSTLVCAICLAGWLMISFMSDSEFYLGLGIHRAYLLIFFVASIIIPYVVGYSTFGNRYLSLALIPLGPLIFDYYKCNGKLGDLKKIIIGIIPFAAVTFYITFTRLSRNSYISRSIKSSGEYSKNLARQGVGGYSFIYFIVVVAVLLLYIFFREKNKWLKWPSLILYLFCFRFLLLSNYVTALVVVVVASAVLIYTYFANKNTANRAILLICIIIGAIILLNINAIIFAVEEYLPKRIAQAIVPESGASVFETLSDEFVSDRWPRMYMSIKTFISNPVFGLMGEASVSYESFSANFGQHSHMLDTVAIFGGLVGIVNLFVVFAPFKDMDGVWIKKGNALNAAMLVCMIGIYIFNNATSSIALALGIIYPLIRENYDLEAKN